MKTMSRLSLPFVLSLLIVIVPLASANKTTSQDQPTIAKDSIQITAFTFNVYKGNYDVWSWVPNMRYRVNGPIPSGSQLYVEYTLPTGAWVKFDCATDTTEKGYWWKTECGGRQIPEEQRKPLHRPGQLHDQVA